MPANYTTPYWDGDTLVFPLVKIVRETDFGDYVTWRINGKACMTEGEAEAEAKRIADNHLFKSREWAMRIERCERRIGHPELRHDFFG